MKHCQKQARLIIADEAISAGLKGEANDQLSKISTEQHNKTYHHLCLKKQNEKPEVKLTVKPNNEVQ